MGKSKQQFERQERELIRLINGLTQNGTQPIDIVTKVVSKDSNENKEEKNLIKDVIRAKKVESISSKQNGNLKQEPYPDISLETLNGEITVSAKGISAPAVGGGGTAGIKIIAGGLLEKFLLNANKYYAQRYDIGDVNIPNFYQRIDDGNVYKLLRGDEQIGGVIDYMYEGSMDVKITNIDLKNNDENVVSERNISDLELDQIANQKLNTKIQVTFNGQFIDINSYAEMYKGKFYIKIRKRRADQPYVGDKEKDSYGLPLVIGRSPSHPNEIRRIVITNKVPSSYEKIEGEGGNEYMVKKVKTNISPNSTRASTRKK